MDVPRRPAWLIPTRAARLLPRWDRRSSPPLVGLLGLLALHEVFVLVAGQRRADVLALPGRGPDGLAVDREQHAVDALQRVERADHLPEREPGAVALHAADGGGQVHPQDAARVQLGLSVEGRARRDAGDEVVVHVERVGALEQRLEHGRRRRRAGAAGGDLGRHGHEVVAAAVVAGEVQLGRRRPALVGDAAAGLRQGRRLLLGDGAGLVVGGDPARGQPDRQRRGAERRPGPPHASTTAPSAASAGSLMTKRAPRRPSGRSSTHTEPPCRRMCSATSDRPSPTPSMPRRCPAEVPRLNREKMISRSSGGPPGPSSSAAISTAWPTLRSSTRVAPSPYLGALSSRLAITRDRRRLSALTTTPARSESMSTGTSTSVELVTAWMTSSSTRTS